MMGHRLERYTIPGMFALMGVALSTNLTHLFILAGAP